MGIDVSAFAKNDAASRESPRERVLPGSPSLAAVVSRDGVSFARFRRELRPRYARVWRDIAARWVLLAGGLALLCAASARWGWGALWLTLPGAVWIGFWFASLVNFMHEGAHFQLHRDKSTNDRLANLAICWMTGDDVRLYRVLHWRHHLHLGDLADTEVSYRHAPTLRYALETLFGVHAWQVFWNHWNIAPDREPTPKGGGRALPFLRGFVVHAAILAVPAWAGLWPAVAAWVLGVAIVFPFCSGLRQQLEHRSTEASSDVDYAEVPHGAVNRMFRRTPFARAFGSAGFDRHLLHHWEPTVSYTCYDELETFFMSTELAPGIDAVRTTYLAAWRQLAAT